MNTPISQEIVERFFKALHTLIDLRKIKSRLAFCRRYDITNVYLYKCEADYTSKVFDMSWLNHLVCDYGVSAYWLMTGQGAMFSPAEETRKKRYKND